MHFMARRLSLTALGCLMLASTAHAAASGSRNAGSATVEPGDLAVRHAMIESGAPQPPSTALDSVPHPWPGIALSLTVVGAAAPIVLMGLASKSNSDTPLQLGILATEIVTPSLGHFYAGLGHRALVGTTVRAVGYGVLAIGAASEGLWSNETPSDFGGGAVLIVLGATVMAGSALTDIITVPGDVDRRNSEWLQQHASVGLRIAPDSTPELAVAVRF